MELRSLYLTRETYGEKKGTLSGNLEVTTISGDIKIRLIGERAEQILAIVTEQLVETAKDVAENITREVIEHAPALEDKSDEV